MTCASASTTCACACRRAAVAASTSCCVVAAFGRLRWRSIIGLRLGLHWPCAEASCACACFRRPGKFLRAISAANLLAGELVLRRLERAFARIAVDLDIAADRYGRAAGPCGQIRLSVTSSETTSARDPRRDGDRAPVGIGVVGALDVRVGPASNRARQGRPGRESARSMIKRGPALSGSASAGSVGDGLRGGRVRWSSRGRARSSEAAARQTSPRVSTAIDGTIGTINRSVVEPRGLCVETGGNDVNRTNRLVRNLALTRVRCNSARDSGKNQR